MQGSSSTQNSQSGVKSTSTPEMMMLFVLSSVAAVVQALAVVGWLTAKVDAGIVQIGFIGLDPPLTSIVFFAALFAIPTALATPVCMFTHWKPNVVLFGSQQLTDTLRGQFAAPFRMKYLYGVMAVVNGLTLISLKYTFFWPVALNILNIVLYVLGLALVFKHFQNPNVPTDLATTAASMIGSAAGAADVARLDALERDVKTLEQELSELKTQLKVTQSDTKVAQPDTSELRESAVPKEATRGPLPGVWGSIFGARGESQEETV